ncbi:MAG: hypothetical protein ACP5NL_07385 [Thermoplasmata archaeon]
MDSPNIPPMPAEQNMPPSAPQRPKLKRSILFTIIAVIVVVVVVVAVAIIILPSSSGPHFGFVPINKAENITGTTLTQSTTSYSGNATYAVTKGEVIYYNSSSGGRIMIVIAQFSNASVASNFYKTEISTATLTTVWTNSTFNGFNYAYISESFSGYYMGLSVGHSGQYFFMIYDINLPITNFNALIQDQISAMT